MNLLQQWLGGSRRQLLSAVHQRPLDTGDLGLTVSFCFDDFPLSAYETGGAILKQFGGRGTYYAAPGLMNTTNELGEQFRRRDLDSLLADGHELGSHTYGHTSCRKVALRDFQKDARKGRQALCDLTGRDVANFAYPFGHVTLAAKRALGREMASCRSIFKGVNAPVVDLNLLKANSLYGAIERFPEFAALVLAGAQQKGWLIFYTHDVRPAPSPFGCTPSLLEKTVEYVTASEGRIVRVDEVIGLLNTRGRECAAGLA